MTTQPIGSANTASTIPMMLSSPYPLPRWLSSLRHVARRWTGKGHRLDTGVDELESDGIHSLASRYNPCDILAKHGIATVVWFEDALVFYGSDTAVFDLYLLVPDAREAAKVLQRAGYQETGIQRLLPGDMDERTCRGGIRLELPNGGSADGTVLVNAAEWNYDLQNREQGSLAPIPPLNKFIDALMHYWLSMSEEEYGNKYLWALSLANLINYCYTLKGVNRDIVRTAQYAEQLLPQFSELHYDLIGDYPQKSGISCYGKHEYHALRFREIQQGKFTPRPYATGNFPPSLAEYPHITGMDAPIPSLGHRKGHSLAPLQSINEGVA
ncbi:Uncharacterized protein TPAR_02076 [Tolypocladium paradoxum]|uniref:Uncharacterized protein n=1 Tax=Tolypocladium paradoxum TaxID=94208 RepID=A0A2S4L5K2_9HYPO|nr:Uncharacterized protein TPAR_02076 [Tolypocladium paradoxum]